MTNRILEAGFIWCNFSVDSAACINDSEGTNIVKCAMILLDESEFGDAFYGAATIYGALFCSFEVRLLKSLFDG